MIHIVLSGAYIGILLQAFERAHRLDWFTLEEHLRRMDQGPEDEEVVRAVRQKVSKRTIFCNCQGECPRAGGNVRRGLNPQTSMGSCFRKATIQACIVNVRGFVYVRMARQGGKKKCTEQTAGACAGRRSFGF